MHVAILGYGEMGRTFEFLLSERASVTIWEKDLNTGEESQPLEEVANAADVVVFAVPATPVPDIAARLAPSLRDSATVFTMAKGVTPDARHPLEILCEVLGADRVAGFYGPMIGDELLVGRQGFADVATTGDKAWEVAVSLFAGTALQLIRAPDPWAAAWSAVAKNLYVPVIGAAAELDLGDNLRGALFVSALDEMRRLGSRLGASGEALISLSGAGDLFTTATSAGSHHYQAGRALARGDRSQTGLEGASVRGEGFHSLQRLRERLDPSPQEFPLFKAAEALLESPAAFLAALDTWGRNRSGEVSS